MKLSSALALAVTMCGAPAAATTSLLDVVRQGYQLVHEEGYLSFDGCEHDKAYVLSSLIFVCQEYGYSYQYGTAIVMGRSFAHQGRDVHSFYLCIGDGQCYQGQLYRR
jgi:hypothetical protein